VEFGSQTDKILGIESSVKYQFKKGSFIELAYTGLNVNSVIGEVEVNSPFDLNYFVRISGEWSLPGFWTLGIRGLFRQGSFYLPVREAIFNDQLNAFEPIFSNPGDEQRLPDYNILDLNVSKLVPVSQNVLIVLFASSANVFDFKNIRSYTHNFDYSERTGELFSRRTFYFGAQINFH
jgi:hypothetical protein